MLPETSALRWVGLAVAAAAAFSAVSASAESAISREWRQRLTDGFRKDVIRQEVNPFSGETASATPTLRIGSPVIADETAPILTSLADLLTQAATETVTFSREMRPSIDWPESFWNLRDVEGWSWRKRLQWFQNREDDSRDDGTTDDRGAASDTGGAASSRDAPVPDEATEDQR